MPCYIIRAGDTDKVKIGWANDPPQRLRELQTGHWDELRIVRLIDGIPATERWLHRHFRAFLIRREWYQFCPEMLTVEPPALAHLPAGNPLIDELFAKFGGRETVMAITGAARNATNNWRHDGLPYKHWPALIEEAKRRGIDGVTFEVLGRMRPASEESAA